MMLEPIARTPFQHHHSEGQPPNLAMLAKAGPLRHLVNASRLFARGEATTTATAGKKQGPAKGSNALRVIRPIFPTNMRPLQTPKSELSCTRLDK